MVKVRGERYESLVLPIESHVVVVVVVKTDIWRSGTREEEIPCLKLQTGHRSRSR